MFPLLRRFLKRCRSRPQREALERSFAEHGFVMRKRTWTRGELYERS